MINKKTYLKESVVELIKKLEDKIKYHKKVYYQGHPEISDCEYDQLENQLREIDPENYVLNLVGSSVDNDPIKHDKKMLSLNKTYEIDDLVKWANGEEIISTNKVDGMSCSLIYNSKGKLSVAKTRGDGIFGENIFDKVLWMDSIPKNISEDNLEKVFTEGSFDSFEIRGELYCDQQSFLELANEMEKLKLDRPTSPRNIVAGILLRKENIELARYIKFWAYEIFSNKLNIQFEEDKFLLLKAIRQNVIDYQKLKTRDDFERVIEEARLFINEGSYQIDGIVFTYNDLKKHDELGETAHHPRYKMAFKFQGETAQTIIENIEWSISRNGVLTPVANVSPVELSGATISRVTLHNFGMCKEYQLKSGVKIEIVRSGEVIPKFLSVVSSSHNQCIDGVEEMFSYPVACPYCNSETIVKDIRLYCSNEFCPGREKEIILNFVQKIGIEDLSTRRLDELIVKGLVKKIPDLYKLAEEDFIKLDKTKEKLAKKLFESIQKTKNVDLITFLSALGISGGAVNKCEKIVRNGINSLEKILNLTKDDLIKIESFAEKSANDFISSLNEKRVLINELIVEGGVVVSSIELSRRESAISGKKICITGALSMKRAEMETMIKDAGGIVVSSVSKNTDYLLTNETDSSSSKYVSAKKNNVTVISEEDMKNLLASITKHV